MVQAVPDGSIPWHLGHTIPWLNCEVPHLSGSGLLCIM